MTSWLDLMGDDSNMSFASMDDENTKSNKFDPEFDNSQQGVNLMFKKNITILSEDSQSRKRTFKEIEQEQKQKIDDDEDSQPPPKAKQRTNIDGRWKQTKSTDTENKQNERNKENKKVNNQNGKTDFSRFLNWAKQSNTTTNANNKSVLSTKSNDNQRNMPQTHNRNGLSSKFVICTPQILHHGRRKQYRRKRTQSLTSTETSTNANNSLTTIPQTKETETETNCNTETDTNAMVLDSDQTMKEKVSAKPIPKLNLNLIENETANAKSNSVPPKNNENISEKKEENKSEVIMKDEAESKEVSVKVTADVEVATPKAQETETENVGTNVRENSVESNNKDGSVECSVPLRKKRRITPTLDKVVLNKDLLFNKVPILKKRDSTSSVDVSAKLNVPVCLNADQYVNLLKSKEQTPTNVEVIIEGKEDTKKETEPEPEPETETNANESVENQEANKGEAEEEEDEDIDATIWTSMDRDDSTKEQQPNSWATKLFADEIERNKALKHKEEALLVEQRKKERIHEMKLEAILPPTTGRSVSDPTVNVNNSVSAMPSVKSFDTESLSPSASMTSTESKVVNPSAVQIEWRKGQIAQGKDTIGYKNYVQRFPNKDIHFRIRNNLLHTPKANDKVGKKRWSGKLKKWRKFLHMFDELEDA